MHRIVTDLSFHSQRRQLQEFATTEKVTSYGYHFIDSLAARSPIAGGESFPYIIVVICLTTLQ
jgi:hypothetical protein